MSQVRWAAIVCATFTRHRNAIDPVRIRADRIYRNIAPPHHVMHMCAGGVASVALQADNLTLRHIRAKLHRRQDRDQMRI